MCRAHYNYIIKILRGGGHSLSSVHAFKYLYILHSLILLHTSSYTLTHTHTHTDDNSKLSCSSDQGSGYPANEEPVISVH